MTFGLHRGMHVEQLPLEYLKWMVVALKDTDYNEFGIRAEEVLKSEEVRLEIINKDLDKIADDFLNDN